jgi:hypothetical protein
MEPTQGAHYVGKAIKVSYIEDPELYHQMMPPQVLICLFFFPLSPRAVAAMDLRVSRKFNDVDAKVKEISKVCENAMYVCFFTLAIIMTRP